ncbi:MAG: MarR family transcriptional regulator [Chloroflexi bacterium]|jgi:DNA-binding MarR family transcriptional regulator|nr:MarR family transcriptional regulator [Chloroflexota bacterium]
MSDRASRIQEATGLYFQILQQLNRHNIPEWLELDLTFQQMKVLYILKQKGGLTMSELSDRLGVSMPTITGIISRLVERKDDSPALVARVTSAEDRRKVTAYLTDAGEKITQQLDTLNRKLFAQALAQLTDGEMEDARAGLSHIANAVSEQRTVTTIETVTPLLNRVLGEEESVVTQVNAEPVALN